MIASRKNRWFNDWFSRHAAGRIRGTFAGLHVRGLDQLRDAAARGPVLVVSNHTSWWDPLICLTLVSHLLRLDGYAMMDARNLSALPFFSLVGAFGVDLSSRTDGAAALRFAAGLLDRPGRVVWIFPQGAERPHTERPLAFKAGSGAVSRLSPGATVMPIGLRYAHGGAERPEIFVEIGPALSFTKDVEQNRAAQEEAVTAAMERIERALWEGHREGRWQGFETFFAWKEPAAARLATRALSAMTRAWLWAEKRWSR